MLGPTCRLNEDSAFGYRHVDGPFGEPFLRVRMPGAHVPPLCFSSAVQIMRPLAKRSAEGDFS